MQYPTLHVCGELLFRVIRTEMATVEPAPNYEEEKNGLNRLESILQLMQRDDYPDLLSKSAYLFCSVIDGHPFSNGNKRLAVTLLTYMLLINGFRISVLDMHNMRQELERLFPKIKWENISVFKRPHEHFFYHLALVIADRAQKGKISFQQERAAVKELLAFIAA